MDDAVEEQELHLYVDDRLDGERRAAFEAALRDHPEIAARVADYRRQNALMRQLFAVPAEEETSEAQGFLVRQLQRRLERRPARRWRGFAAAAAGLLVAALLGAAGTELYHERSATEPEPMANFAETAALLHSVYAGGGEQAEFGADGVAKLSSMLPTRLGAPLHVPDLSRKGFTLVGGRLLAAPEGPAAQLLYRDQAGRLVTVLLGASQGTQSNVPPLQQRQDLSLYTWLDGRIGVAVVGKLNRDELRGLAEAAQRTLLPPPSGARPDGVGGTAPGVASRT
jgi:anti-sigma factor RsiW